MNKHAIRRLLCGAALTGALVLGTCGCGEQSLTPEGENKKGLAAYDSGQFEEAAKRFEKAISLDAQKEYRNNYGMALLQSGRAEEALNEFAKVMDLMSSDKAQKRLNKFALRGSGMACLQLQRFEDALSYFNQALEIREEPDWNLDILYYKANTLLCMGYPDSAIDVYGEVIAIDEGNIKGRLARAALYREAGQYERAMEDYKSLLALEACTYEAYIGMYSCCHSLGKTEEGVGYLEQATRLEVKSDYDKYLLGQIHFYQGNLEAAKIEMEYAIRREIWEAYYFLGEIALAQKDYDTAIEQYQCYREKNVTESPNVINQLVVCHLATYQYDEAAKLLAIGLRYEGTPAYQRLLRNQVAMYEGMAEYQLAYDCLKEYIVRFPDDIEATNEYRYLKGLLGIE